MAALRRAGHEVDARAAVAMMRLGAHDYLMKGNLQRLGMELHAGLGPEKSHNISAAGH